MGHVRPNSPTRYSGAELMVTGPLGGTVALVRSYDHITSS